MVAQRETPTVCAFIRITDDADRILRQNGCQKLAQAGNIYIAAIPADRLGALSQERNVSRIEARRGTHALMDSMAIHLNALPVYAGTSLPQAYTGKDVVMGIMDIGFDLTHPNFYDAQASNYRIKRLWDQISPDTIGSSLFVGRDYSGERELHSHTWHRSGQRLQQPLSWHGLGERYLSGEQCHH